MKTKRTKLLVLALVGCFSIGAQAAPTKHAKEGTQKWVQEPTSFLGITLDQPIQASVPACRLQLVSVKPLDEQVYSGLINSLEVVNSKSNAEIIDRYSTLLAQIEEFEKTNGIKDSRFLPLRHFIGGDPGIEKAVYDLKQLINLQAEQKLDNLVKQGDIFGLCEKDEFVLEKNHQSSNWICENISLKMNEMNEMNEMNDGMCYRDDRFRKYNIGEFSLYGHTVLGIPNILLSNDRKISEIKVDIARGDYSRIVEMLIVKYGRPHYVYDETVSYNYGNNEQKHVASWEGDRVIIKAESGVTGSVGSLTVSSKRFLKMQAADKEQKSMDAARGL